MRNKLILIIGLFCLPSCRKNMTKLHGGFLENKSELVIVVSGQSNGVSDTRNVIPHSEYAYSTTGRVSVIYNGEITHPSKQFPGDRSASWIYLADMISIETDRDVKIVNVSHGGHSTRNFLNNWQAELQETIKTYKPELVIWVQGESDTLENIPTSESYENMKKIIGDTYKEAHWFIALDGYTCQEFGGIRETQKRLIREGFASQGPDIDRMRALHPDWFDYNTLPKSIYPGTEFAYDGLKEHAKEWFKILKNEFK